MSPWLRALLGLEEGEIPQGGITRLEFAGMPQGWWALAAVLILALAVALVVLVYRRESELGPGKRILLAGLRLFALALVVLVLLNPRLAVELRARKPAQTILLADGSGSMGTVDQYEPADGRLLGRVTGLDVVSGYDRDRNRGPNRARLVGAALERSRLVEELARRNPVRCYAFGEGIEAVEGKDLPGAVRKAPEAGKSTWIGSAIREAVDAAGSQLVAGVVLISDGRLSGGEPLAGARAELEARGIPVHVLGVGKMNLRKNISILEVNAPEVAETGLPLRIRVRVRSTGYPGESGGSGEIEATLSRARAGERAYQPIGSQMISLRSFTTEEVVNFTDIPPRNGRYHYLVEIEPQPGEEKDWDNRSRVDVLVASESCRVLLIAGSPNFEFRYLRNFFLRDPGIQLSSWLQSADPAFPQEGDLPIKALPADASGIRPFDVVVLLDPDSMAFPGGFGLVLQNFVADQGGGLAFVAGQHHTARLAVNPEGRRLLALLPVQLGNPPGNDHRMPWRFQLTPAGASHSICQLSGIGLENRRLWSVFPEFYFRYPVQGLKPGASSLWDYGGEPVLAVHQSGAGRVLFLGTDDLYRWREYRESVHEQFWSGVTRFLALGKRLAGTRKVSIVTDRERYLVGDEVRIEAHVLDSSYQPIPVNQVVARLEMVKPLNDGGNGNGPDGGDPDSGNQGKTPGQPTGQSNEPAEPREVYLEAIQGRPGWFRGRVKVEGTGNYRLALADSSTEGLPAAFVVSPPSGELENTTPDFSALEDLARGTGGSFSMLSRIQTLPPRIPDRTVFEVLGRKTATLWDSATLLLVLAGALILEWILRKRWHLC